MDSRDGGGGDGGEAARSGGSLYAYGSWEYRGTSKASRFKSSHTSCSGGGGVGTSRGAERDHANGSTTTNGDTSYVNPAGLGCGWVEAGSGGGGDGSCASSNISMGGRHECIRTTGGSGGGGGGGAAGAAWWLPTSDIGFPGRSSGRSSTLAAKLWSSPREDDTDVPRLSTSGGVLYAVPAGVGSVDTGGSTALLRRIVLIVSSGSSYTLVAAELYASCEPVPRVVVVCGGSGGDGAGVARGSAAP